jgi:hypothetical protein
MRQALIVPHVLETGCQWLTTTGAEAASAVYKPASRKPSNKAREQRDTTN